MLSVVAALPKGEVLKGLADLFETSPAFTGANKAVAEPDVSKRGKSAGKRAPKSAGKRPPYANKVQVAGAGKAVDHQKEAERGREKSMSFIRSTETMRARGEKYEKTFLQFLYKSIFTFYCRELAGSTDRGCGACTRIPAPVQPRRTGRERANADSSTAAVRTFTLYHHDQSLSNTITVTL
jgi:hypothetical protein